MIMFYRHYRKYGSAKALHVIQAEQKDSNAPNKNSMEMVDQDQQVTTSGVVDGTYNDVVTDSNTTVQ